MADLCNKLKYDLEHYFSMPFNVSSSVKDGEEHYICSPANDGAMFFDVDVYIHNHIRLVVEMYPQKHGGYILNEMANADKEKQKRFSFCKEMLEDKGARVVFLVNGSDLFSLGTWPKQWRTFSSRIKLVPIPDSKDELAIITEWLQYSFDFVFSLLTIIDTTDEETPNSIQTEGTPSEIRSIRYERNPINRQLCLHRKGYSCSICGMNFYDVYGDIGYHFIEVHHTTPVSAMEPGYVFDVDKDLVPLCPNCHAMVHRRNPPYNVDEIKKLLRK